MVQDCSMLFNIVQDGSRLLLGKRFNVLKL